MFFYGKSKTRSLALQNNLKLNALPKFYGYYLVLWCSIPSLVFLLIWTLFEPIIIKSIIIDNAAKLGANISDKNEIKIDMTLTNPNCPVAGSMPENVGKSIETLPNLNSVEVSLVWNPKWHKDLMSEEAKLALDIF